MTTNLEQTKRLDEAFERAIELPLNEPLSWEMLSKHVFQINVPSRNDKGAWSLYLIERNGYKRLINERCAAYGENWRLYMRTNGVDLIKQEKRGMVKTEMAQRMKRAAEAYALFRKHLNPMLTADGLTSKDKKMLRQMVAVGQGSAVAMAGQIGQMTAFNKEEKLELSSVLFSFSGDSEGDE